MPIMRREVDAWLERRGVRLWYMRELARIVIRDMDGEERKFRREQQDKPKGEILGPDGKPVRRR